MASETSSDDMRRRKGGGAVPRGASSAPSGDAKGTVTAHGYPRGRVTAGAIWRFGRPHTIIGTTISIISVTACALDTTEQMTLAPVVAALGLAIATSLLMNVYIVGLNQMTDVAIDRINKPRLPVASGELTIAQGWRIVYASAVLSVGGGYLLGEYCAHPTGLQRSCCTSHEIWSGRQVQPHYCGRCLRPCSWAPSTPLSPSA